MPRSESSGMIMSRIVAQSVTPADWLLRANCRCLLGHLANKHLLRRFILYSPPQIIPNRSQMPPTRTDASQCDAADGPSPESVGRDEHA